MGDQASIGPFVADDSFLRRIDRKRHIHDDSVTWEAFKPRESEQSISFTYRDGSLNTQEGLQRYHRDRVLPLGDLPGICKLAYYDLTVSLEPPLPPRSEPDLTDTKYGHLHCCTDCPRNEIHMEMMAKLATRYGILCPFVRHKKRAGGER